MLDEGGEVSEALPPDKNCVGEYERTPGLTARLAQNQVHAGEHRSQFASRAKLHQKAGGHPHSDHGAVPHLGGGPSRY